jgi:hypothetical protein
MILLDFSALVVVENNLYGIPQTRGHTYYMRKVLYVFINFNKKEVDIESNKQNRKRERARNEDAIT